MDNSVTIDDPVKMYLKEIGALKLLDSEEEIVLAKQVEKVLCLMLLMKIKRRPRRQRRNWQTGTFVSSFLLPKSIWAGGSSFSISSRKEIWAF